jgi:hypothetical protein
LSGDDTHTLNRLLRQLDRSLAERTTKESTR